MMDMWQPIMLDTAQVEPCFGDQVAFIGDVHGYLQRLDYLLKHIDPSCHIVFLGDLIDRGPDSRQVVQRVRELVAAGRASVIIGNHEYALVRGLGLPEAGIPGNEQLFRAWYERYGGDTTLNSYGLYADDHDLLPRLREALGDDLDFLAGLPWYLWGSSQGRKWLAVHAGLDARSLREQLSECAVSQRWLRQDLPRFLYAKDRQHSRAHDLEPQVCLVSGHTPQDHALVSEQRILADTSGGRQLRPLSAVLWPDGGVIASPAAQF